MKETQLSREEYVDLMGLLRPRVSDRLGVSVFHSHRECENARDIWF